MLPCDRRTEDGIRTVRLQDKRIAKNQNATGAIGGHGHCCLSGLVEALKNDSSHPRGADIDMATATFRSSRKERSSDRGRGFFDRFLVRAGHDVALDLRSEAWETNWWVGTTLKENSPALGF
jgi:hypothetical protein